MQRSHFIFLSLFVISAVITLGISAPIRAESDTVVELNSRYSAAQLQQSCDIIGGTFIGRSRPDGSYSCRLDSGNVTCSGFDNSCVGTRYHDPGHSGAAPIASTSSGPYPAGATRSLRTGTPEDRR